MFDGQAKDAHRYDDLIRLPHPNSATHPRMPRSDRAAQFSPFAALTGFGAAIDETARLTDRRMELDEDGKAALDSRLRLLKSRQGEQPEVRITYFQPDEKKTGGAYVTVKGAVRNIDGYRKTIRLLDGATIPVKEVYAIEGALFCELDP